MHAELSAGRELLDEKQRNDKHAVGDLCNDAVAHKLLSISEVEMIRTALYANKSYAKDEATSL